MAALDLSTLIPQRKALGAFCVMPNMRYSQQEPGEKLLLILRASPYTQVIWVINSVMAFVLLIVGIIYLASYIDTMALILCLLVGLSLIFTYSWYNFVIWYYNLGIISTVRLVDIDYYGISKRVTTETLITKVADATAKTTGFFGQILNYGDVFVVTDGPAQNIEFLNVPDPDLVVSIINSAMGAAIAHESHV
ncbi:MAG: hypothetical protein WCO78_00840 [Candidatus Roizmanbacteria bacterium]